MRKRLVWLVIAAALLAACLADNETIWRVNQMTARDVLEAQGIHFDSPVKPPPARPTPPPDVVIDGGLGF